MPVTHTGVWVEFMLRRHCMTRRYLALLAILILAACGCSKGVPVAPATDSPSGWVVESGTLSMREANPYLDITEQALPRIRVQVDKYIPMKILELTLTLTNDTAYTPRNLAVAFEVPLAEPDGMTDRGSNIPWNFRLFNGGDKILKGVPYEADVHLDISHSGLGFEFYVIGLIGNDPLNEKFVYEESNDWYDMGNHAIRLGRMNGSYEDTGLTGKFPMISGNGRYVAVVKLPAATAYFVIKDTWTGDTTEIHCSIPGCSSCRVGWGVFDYEGKYFVYMAGQKQYREYLWLRNMETGSTELIEGAFDGSQICAAFGVDISGDGTMVSYNYDDNPISMYSFFQIRTYDILTGEKKQWTNGDNENCDTSINYNGTRVSYRCGYFVPPIKGGDAAMPSMDYHTSLRQGEIPFSSLVRHGDVSIYVVYELRSIDLITGEDRLLVEKVVDPPNYVCDARMDWAGNWIIYRDQPHQWMSTYTTVYAIRFDGSEKIQLTNDTTHYKMVPFMSGDFFYAGWDIYMGEGGIWASDFDDSWEAINVGMWPDNGV